jgi:CRISPR-associated endoribonuclease Cas6
MPTIQTLSLHFDLPMRGNQIPQFRGAIAEAAGLENDLMHNHSPDGSNLQRYPLVQYRIRHGNAAIFAINEGVEAVQQWLFRSGGSLQVSGETLALKVLHMDAKEYTLEMTDKPRWYYLSRYLALNTDYYRQWVEAPNLEARIKIIQKNLESHLLTFARAVDWRLQENMNLNLQQIVKTQQVRYHGVPLVAFDLVFSANLWLPRGVAIGKAVSHGYGVQYPVKAFSFNRKTEENHVGIAEEV